MAALARTSARRKQRGHLWAKIPFLWKMYTTHRFDAEKCHVGERAAETVASQMIRDFHELKFYKRNETAPTAGSGKHSRLNFPPNCRGEMFDKTAIGRGGASGTAPSPPNGSGEINPTSQ